MAKEIERKFLVTDNAWMANKNGVQYRQGYISTSEKPITVRIRIAGEKGIITLKGPAKGIEREEFEYAIPRQEADYMLSHFCGAVVEKTRYKIDHHGHTWEVDVFKGRNKGLVLAEIELQAENEEFARPSWLGKEVTGDKRYYNAYLARRPYTTWKTSK